MTASFDVEREISVRALERAMETGQEIFLVTQRELGVELPEEKDLYEVGTVARVIQILRASNSDARRHGGRQPCAAAPPVAARAVSAGAGRADRRGKVAAARHTHRGDAAPDLRSSGEYSELLPKQPESIFTTVMDATDPGFSLISSRRTAICAIRISSLCLRELRPLMRLRRVNEIPQARDQRHCDGAGH